MKRQSVDAALARVLAGFQDDYIRDWPRAFGDMDFPALRDEVSSLRGRAVADLSGLADRFEAAVSARGVTVHRVSSGAGVARVIAGICARLSARLAVKTKSMTTEELDLNARLSTHGVRCVETDLGEWIVQQSGEKPSHMVMPAVHLHRRDVAAIMSRATSEAVPPGDIGHMVGLARSHLRKEFLAADIGITGANMLAADRGMVIMVTNEGNGRLVITMPPVHVVVAGYEKLVPSLESAAPVLRALTRSATRQALTSYVTMVGAPSGGGSARLSGVDVEAEMHVILVDGGRLEAARGPWAGILKCIRCGACANVCPVYSRVGGHVMAGILPGPAGVLLGPALGRGPEPAAGLCLGCGRCGEVCPVDAGIPDLMLRAKELSPAPLPERAAFRLVLPRRLVVGAGVSALRAAGRLTGGRGIALPGGRRVPQVAGRSFGRVARELETGTGPIVALYTGCLVDHVYPGIGRAAWELMSGSGYRVVYPENQLCCGAPMLYAGDPKGAARQLRATARAILEVEPRHVVTPCPTCTWFLRHLLPRLVDGPEASLVAGMTLDFAEMAGRVEVWSGEGPAASWPVTYHDSCHLRWKLGVHGEPRSALRSLPGVDYREMEGADRCCGFAGSYSFKQPDIARALLDAKLDRCLEVGGHVAVACPGCLLHLSEGARARSLDIEFSHLASLLSAPPGCDGGRVVVESGGGDDGKE